MANNSMTVGSLISQNSPSSSESDCATTCNLSTKSTLQRKPNPPIACQNDLSLVNPIGKKTRGRPAGSKNKPKVITRPSPIPVGPLHVMVNVGPGRDIMESILIVARKKSVNLTVLSASGTISSVTLLRNWHHGATTTTVTLNGPLTLISINGTYSSIHQYPPLSFSINLSTSQAQLIGGTIAGTVIASDNVCIVLSTYINLDFYNFVPPTHDGA